MEALLDWVRKTDADSNDDKGVFFIGHCFFDGNFRPSTGLNEVLGNQEVSNAVFVSWLFLLIGQTTLIL